MKSFLESFIVSGFCEKFNIKRMAESHEPLVLQVPASAVESEPIKDQASSSTLPKETTGISSCLCIKYARILLFQFVFTKYVFGFRNYDGLIFVVFDVIFQNVIMRKYDKIRF